MSPAEALDAERLTKAVAGQKIGHRIIVLAETSSTNDVAFQLSAEHEEGLVVFAERQTAGRGQHGRRWESAAGAGLWFSILLGSKIAPNESSRITSWAAETVAATIRDELRLPAEVKPPNDVYIAGRKVAGVLLELRAVAGAPNVGILGIGLNVNQSSNDFPEELRATATSLAIEQRAPVDRPAVAIALLRALERTRDAATEIPGTRAAF